MNKKKTKQMKRSAIGGLVGRSEGGSIENCRFKGQLKVNGDPKDIDISDLVGRPAITIPNIRERGK